MALLLLRCWWLMMVLCVSPRSASCRLLLFEKAARKHFCAAASTPTQGL